MGSMIISANKGDNTKGAEGYTTDKVVVMDLSRWEDAGSMNEIDTEALRARGIDVFEGVRFEYRGYRQNDNKDTAIYFELFNCSPSKSVKMKVNDLRINTTPYQSTKIEVKVKPKHKTRERIVLASCQEDAIDMIEVKLKLKSYKTLGVGKEVYEKDLIIKL